MVAGSTEFVNVNHFREKVSGVREGHKLAVIFYDPLAEPCWEPTAAFHRASTNPAFTQRMSFFTINASRTQDMEAVLEELNITLVPMVAFWDGRNWERVTLRENNVLAVLESRL